MAYTTINKSTDNFNTVTYTGNGSTQSITGVGFQPDWCWIKRRNGTASHEAYDAVRGTGKVIYPDASDAQVTHGTSYFNSFDSDGFSFLGGNSGLNGNSDTYAAWNWKAGTGAGSSNTDGTINTTYTSANQTSGFSICTWTGTGSAGTIGHGLNAVPKMIMVKRLDGADTWWVYHSALGTNDGYLALNEQNAGSTSGGSGLWNSTGPTSSVFSVGTNTGVNGSGGTYVAYVFAEKTGYSKISNWTGNANANGIFTYCGFKPTFLLAKNTASATSWLLFDSKRDTANSVSKALFPDSSSAEYDYTTYIDFVSNGIKVKHNGNSINGSGHSIAFLAFGQSLVGSNNVPCTAR